MKKLLLVFCIAVSAFVGTQEDASAAAVAQKDTLAHIVGIVKDGGAKGRRPRFRGMDYFPLGQAIVTLYYKHGDKIDSVYTTTGYDGKFVFRNLKPQRVGLQIRNMGYRSESGVYEIESGENAFYFTLNPKSEELKEAKVEAEIPLVKQIKDTTIFNTQAVRTMEEDNLKTVLESLPGFEVSDDGVTVNGVAVSKTYVNGKLIFGDKTMTAINLLKAKDVTQVKVYDQQTAVDKHRGLKNSENERVLDVITKEKFLSFFSVGVGAAGGLDETRQERYHAAAAGRYDSEMLEINIGGGAGNLGTSGRGGFRGGYGPIAATFVPTPNSLGDYAENENAVAGVRKHWKDREFGNSLNAIYNFTHDYNRSASVALNEYFENQDTPHMMEADTSSSSSSTYTHTVSIGADLKDTKIKSISFGVNGSYTTNDNDGFNGSAKQTDGMPDELRHEFTGAQSKNYSVGANVAWTNNDPVKWRPYVSADFTYGNNDNLSWTVDTMATSFVNRQLKSDGWGKNMAANLNVSASGVLVNEENRTINTGFGVRGNYDNGKSRQMTTNEWDVPSPVIDLANSYDYTHHSVNASAFWNMNYSDAKKRNLSFQISAKDIYLIDNEYYPADYNTNKNFILPEFNLSYKRDSKGEAYLSGSMGTPAIEQIRNRISDSNPMILTGGNPNLNCSYTFNAGGRYSPVTVRNTSGYSQYFYLGASGSCTVGQIVNQSKYFYEETVLDAWDGYVAPAGSMLYTYTNSDIPAWRVNADVTYSGSVKGNKFGFDVVLGAGYAQSPQYSAAELIWVGDASANGTLRLKYRPSRKLFITEDFTTKYIESRNADGSVISNRFIFDNRTMANWSPLTWLSLRANYRFDIYKYVSGSGVDHDVHNLAASIAFFPRKDRSLKIEISGNDLLNSGSTYTSSITASSMIQTWKPTYGRYYLLSVTYLFRHKNNKR